MFFWKTEDYFWMNAVNIFTTSTLNSILMDLGFFLFIYTKVLITSDFPTTYIPYLSFDI